MTFAAKAIGFSIGYLTDTPTGDYVKESHLIEAADCLMQSLEAGEDRGLALSWLREIYVTSHGVPDADVEIERFRVQYDYTGRIPQLSKQERRIEGLLILTGFGEQQAKNEAYQQLKQHFSSTIQHYAKKYHQTLCAEHPDMNVVEFAAEGIFKAAIAYKSTIKTEPSGFIRLEIRNHLYDTVNNIDRQQRLFTLCGKDEEEYMGVPDPGIPPLGALCEMELKQKLTPTIERFFVKHFRHQPKKVELYTTVFKEIIESNRRFSSRELSKRLRAQGILVGRTKANEVRRKGNELLKGEPKIRDLY